MTVNNKTYQKPPFLPGWEVVRGLFYRGYGYFLHKGEQLGSDVFRSNLFFQPIIFGYGQQLAELVYDTTRFARANAMPGYFKNVLFGKDGIQGLDDDRHRTRKQLLMDQMTDVKILTLQKLVLHEMNIALTRWELTDKIVFFKEINQVLFRAACRWCGMPFSESEVKRKAEWTNTVIEGAASWGIKHWYGMFARVEMEEWIAREINRLRKHGIKDGSIISSIAFYREDGVHELSLSQAAVEVFNLIRPIQAISRYIVYMVIALEEHRDFREKLHYGEEKFAERFVQEVRRYFPFFPFVATVAKTDIYWNNLHWKKGTKVFLDIYGTNHDPRIYHRPMDFDPYRFKDFRITPFNFIPQGGGDHFFGHRCAGEWLTIELMKCLAKYLTRNMKYEVPKRYLKINGHHFPPMANKRIVLEWVVPKSYL